MDNTTEKPHEFVNTQRLLESANDSARHFRNVFTAYLTVMIYTLIVILSTDQELLFRAGSKQLPLVNINVPIKEFFIYMPWALLVIHFYLLIQASFLSDKVRDYASRIGEGVESQEEIDKAHRLLFPVPLAHTFVAEKPQWILSLIIFVSLVIFPLVTLITAQIKFLPYQSEWITWQHHFIIIIDLVLLWYFGDHIYISKNKNSGKEKLSKWPLYFIPVFAFLLILLLTMFFFLVLNFPGERPIWLQKLTPEIRLNHFDLPNSILVKREPPPEVLANYSLTRAILADSMPIDSMPIDSMPTDSILADLFKDNSVQDDLIWCEFAEPLNLGNRNLRKAKLFNAKICNADLTGTDLTRADLRETVLIQAILTKANLREADFTQAVLTQANPTEANFTQAVLTQAVLIQAILTQAVLTQAVLTQAVLTQADLTGADLTEAVLTGAVLTDADLTGANLTRADFTGADLTKVDLTQADLTGADFFGVGLSETDFTSARTINIKIDYSWIWKDSNKGNTEYLPVGIPKDGKNTPRPNYLCPRSFNIRTYVDFSKYANKKQKLIDEKRKLMSELSLSGLELLRHALDDLKSELRTKVAGIIEKNCELYVPKVP